MGPLLYHFADVYGQGDVSFHPLEHIPCPDMLRRTSSLKTFLLVFQDMSIELSLEDVKRVALHYGFHIEVTSFTFFSVY